MAITFTVSEHGTRGALRKLDPNKMKRARNKGVNRAANFMLTTLQAHSRIDKGIYVGSWRKRGSGQDTRTIFNDAREGTGRRARYAKYVTGVTQRTKFDPQEEAGAFFMRKMRRENTGKLREIILKTIREEYAT